MPGVPSSISPFDTDTATTRSRQSPRAHVKGREVRGNAAFLLSQFSFQETRRTCSHWLWPRRCPHCRPVGDSGRAVPTARKAARRQTAPPLSRCAPSGQFLSLSEPRFSESAAGREVTRGARGVMSGGSFEAQTASGTSQGSEAPAARVTQDKSSPSQGPGSSRVLTPGHSAGPTRLPPRRPLPPGHPSRPHPHLQAWDPRPHTPRRVHTHFLGVPTDVTTQRGPPSPSSR